jgi:hypothetical protein
VTGSNPGGGVTRRVTPSESVKTTAAAQASHGDEAYVVAVTFASSDHAGPESRPAGRDVAPDAVAPGPSSRDPSLVVARAARISTSQSSGRKSQAVLSDGAGMPGVSGDENVHGVPTRPRLAKEPGVVPAVVEDGLSPSGGSA